MQYSQKKSTLLTYCVWILCLLMVIANFVLSAVSKIMVQFLAQSLATSVHDWKFKLRTLNQSSISIIGKCIFFSLAFFYFLFKSVNNPDYKFHIDPPTPQNIKKNFTSATYKTKIALSISSVASGKLENPHIHKKKTQTSKSTHTLLT